MNSNMSLRGNVPSKAEAISDSRLLRFARNDDRYGFSILEMIVVIALIATITGIFIVRSSGMQDQRQMDKVKGDLRAIQTAINNYYFHHANTYPSGTDWMTNDLINDTPRVLRQIVFDPFRQLVERDRPGPRPTTEYSYYTSSDGKYYVAFSYGPDRQRDISSIDNNGKLTGTNDDDIFVTNGTGTF